MSSIPPFHPDGRAHLVWRVVATDVSALGGIVAVLWEGLWRPGWSSLFLLLLCFTYSRVHSIRFEAALFFPSFPSDALSPPSPPSPL